MWYDDPYEECYDWFWQSLGEDNTLSKDFLEHLQRMVEDVQSGKVKTYPLEDVMEELKQMTEDEDT